jgi:hypothetical protein
MEMARFILTIFYLIIKWAVEYCKIIDSIEESKTRISLRRFQKHTTNGH